MTSLGAFRSKYFDPSMQRRLDLLGSATGHEPSDVLTVLLGAHAALALDAS